MWRTGGSIAAIRLAMLALRFALTIYITSALGLAAMGQFGLVMALAAFAPALFGFGLNFHMARDAVHLGDGGALAVVRDRLAWSVKVLVVATTLGLPFAILGLNIPPVLAALVTAILWGETLGADIYIALTALRMNVLANVSIALRSAVWIPAAIGLGAMAEGFRSLTVVLGCWVAGQMANLTVTGLILLRRLPNEGPGDTPPHRWAESRLRDGLQIWPSDLALVLIAFGDRLILSATVSDRLLGVYVFYWTFANVAQTLVQSAIVAPALPRLILAHRESREGWLRLMRRLAMPVVAFGAALGAGGLLLIGLGHRFAPQLGFPWMPGFGVVMVLATTARLVGDFLSAVLNSAGAAKAYAVLNIGFAAALATALVPMSAGWGITGAATALLAVSLIFDGLKYRTIRRIEANPSLA